MVTEYISVFCSHCNSFQPISKMLKEQLPEGIPFNTKHVSFMGRDMGIEMNKAHATMIKLGVKQRVLPALFAAIHKQNKAPQNVDQIREIFINNGVSGSDFDRTFNSQAILQVANSYDSDFYANGLTGTPSVVINNKYLANAGGVTSFEEYLELVNYLIKK